MCYHTLNLFYCQLTISFYSNVENKLCPSLLQSTNWLVVMPLYYSQHERCLSRKISTKPSYRAYCSSLVNVKYNYHQQMYKFVHIVIVYTINEVDFEDSIVDVTMY